MRHASPSRRASRDRDGCPGRPESAPAHDVTGAPPWHSALLDSAALHRLANFKPLELRWIEIQGLVVSCPTMSCPESFRFSPCFKDGTVFPQRFRSIKTLIVRFRAREEGKLPE